MKNPLGMTLQGSGEESTEKHAFSRGRGHILRLKGLLQAPRAAHSVDGESVGNRETEKKLTLRTRI